MKRYNRWTREECDVLEQFYPTMHPDDLLLKLPRHTMKAIYCKAKYFGLSRTKEYIKYTRKEGSINFQRKQKEAKDIFVSALKSAYRLVELGDEQQALSVIAMSLDELNGKSASQPEQGK